MISKDEADKILKIYPDQEKEIRKRINQVNQWDAAFIKSERSTTIQLITHILMGIETTEFNRLKKEALRYKSELSRHDGNRLVAIFIRVCPPVYAAQVEQKYFYVSTIVYKTGNKRRKLYFSAEHICAALIR